MEWQKEANAVIDDIKPFVRCIGVCQSKESSNMRIYLDVETFEEENLLIAMDSRGFTICKDGRSEEGEDETYESINALLFNNSPKYRETFTQSLVDKINSLRDS